MAHPALARSVITPALIEKFASAGHWQWRGWVSQLLAHAHARPDAVAVVASGRATTFGQLARRAGRVAAELGRLGIGPGDIVGVQLPNVVEFHVFRYALASLGAVLLPIGVVYRERELLHALGLTEACAIVVAGTAEKFDHAGLALRLQSRLPSLRHVIVAGGAAPAGAMSCDAWLDDACAAGAHPLVEDAASPNDVDMLLLSSGTTGLPKVIMVTPNAWLHAGAVTMRVLQTTPADIILALPPLAGGAGYNNGVGSPAVSGATVVLQPTFEAEGAVALLESEGVTVVAAVPAQAIKMIEVLEARALSAQPARTKVRAWLSVGAHLPAHSAQRLESLLECRVVNIYGAVEAAAIAGNGLDDPATSRHTSIGRLVDGTELRLVDEDGRDVPAGEAGDLLTRQPAMAAGYFNDEAATLAVFDAQGWVRTGDCALIDGDGTIRIEGRKKDVINRGGMKISAAEIEDELRSHPAVLDVAVVGMPDPVFGEKACAYVVKRADATLVLADLTSFLRGREIATFKLPERLEVVAEFPLSSGFKVQKSALREDIARKLASEQS